MFLGNNKRGSQISLRAEQNCIQCCGYTITVSGNQVSEDDQFTLVSNSWELHNWEGFMPNLFIYPLCGQRCLRWQWLLRPLLISGNGICGGLHHSKIRMEETPGLRFKDVWSGGLLSEACLLLLLTERAEVGGSRSWVVSPWHCEKLALEVALVLESMFPIQTLKGQRWQLERMSFRAVFTTLLS